MSLCVSKPDVFWSQGRLNQTHDRIADCIECIAEPISSAITILSKPFKEQKSTSSAESLFVEEILKHFYIRGDKIISPARVIEYLLDHPEIAELSKKVSDEVFHHFDYRAKLYHIVRDYDDPNSEYLALYIRVPEYDNSVMERIERIREGYYQSLNEMTGWFLLTTDFIPAR